MSDQIHMRLGNPFLIGIWSLALLGTGAAIGARWGHSPQVAVWIIVASAGLMIAHDTVAFTIIFLLSTSWASRAIREREVSAANTQEATADTGSPRTPRSGGRARARRKD
jgi:hypothetical protein